MEPLPVVLCVDGGDGAAGSAAVQFHHQRAVFEIFSNQFVLSSRKAGGGGTWS
jgi:hypothetical protein